MATPIEVRGDVDPRAVEQLARCAEAGSAVRGVLCADGHIGYSQPIGGAVAYPDHISPSGVGYDIACGNKAARTNLLVDDVLPDLSRIMDVVFQRISFGVGRQNEEPVDHPVLDAIRQADFEPQHVDLSAGDDGHLWVGVHFGSRGFGHRTATGFLALAAGLAFDGKPAGGEMDSPPVLLHVESNLGRSYVAAIVWVVRKGCTPAFPGQQGFVGATMGEPSVILEGVEGDGARGLLYSTVHGAGRVMSRTEAAGRSRKRWACPHCGWTQGRGTHVGHPRRCPSCGQGGLIKRWVLERPGQVDWPATTASLREAGIELRGGAADEAPAAYKRLDAVLGAHTDAVRVLHDLRPIGVAMAGADIFDPYND